MDLGCNIKKLAELFKQDEDSSSDDDDLPKCGQSKLGPGNISSMVKVKCSGVNNDDEVVTDVKSDPNSIWTLEEVPQVPFCDDASYDPRQRPDYEFRYRQAVGAENLYLQLGQKTPATASCEILVIIISLIGEQRSDIDLCVTKQHLDLRSPLYRLSLPFPHEVDPESSSAEWKDATSTLTVSLALKREFDFVNF